MMLGERRSYGGDPTTVHVPPWFFAADDPASFCPSPNGGGGGSVQSLPLKSNDAVSEPHVDAHTCDNFRMFEFKVRRCGRGRSHDWTECPYAHPGEKARRRDPRQYHYSCAACPDFRRGACCRRGDACEFAHGVFECWLHPARYRTQPCKDGAACRRRVCFFAHSPDELRVLSPRGPVVFVSSPEPGSPPAYPVNKISASLRQLQVKKVSSSLPSCCSWIDGASPRPEYFISLPSTPTESGMTYLEAWGEEVDYVESGRHLRAKMFEKLSKDNPLDRAYSDPNPK